MRLYQGLLLFLFAGLISCKTIYTPVGVNFAQQDVKQSVIDSSFIIMLKPYKDSLDISMNQVIARLDQDLDKKMPEGSLGNMMADALLIQAEKVFGIKPDLALMNTGGIRLPAVKAGDITLGKIYELHPFDNKLVMMRVSGKTLQDLLDLTASKGGWPVAGVRMTIKNKQATGILVRGYPLDLSADYWIALSDYVATGGDDADMLKIYKVEQKDYLIRTAIIDYLSGLQKMGQSYQIGTEKRVQYAE
jgi:2',3'-cyclic-nucleotide 2'-phosphodiesterase (5'-nucleotidase family)